MKKPLKNTLPQLEFLKKIKLFNIYRFNNILYRVHFSRHFVFDFVDEFHTVMSYNISDSQLDKLGRLCLILWGNFGAFCGALRFSVQLH